MPFSVRGKLECLHKIAAFAQYMKCGISHQGMQLLLRVVYSLFTNSSSDPPKIGAGWPVLASVIDFSHL